MIEDALKDKQSTNSEWDLPKSKIDGVIFKETKNIITSNGVTTEGYRDDWRLHDDPIRQIINVSMRPGSVSAWHMHGTQKDHIFVILGTFQAALYDGREGSPTYRQVEVRNISIMRPGVLVIPPGVWHGFKNVTSQDAMFVNYFDQAYIYADPDEFRLPPDTDEIPFKFKL